MPDDRLEVPLPSGNDRLILQRIDLKAVGKNEGR
jgi:hypothetical protein